MMKTLSLALLLAAVTACGGGSKSAPATTTATTASMDATVELALAEMKVIDLNKNKALLIHADGTIELEGMKAARVTTDGKIVKIDTGEVGFTLSPSGAVSGPDGKDLGISLSADGVITTGDKTISIDAAGELIGGNPDAPRMKIEGATDVKLKRTALFVLIALTGSASAAPPPDATATP